MIKWIEGQIKFVVSQWDHSIETHYPQYLRMWRDPKENYRCINKEWNLLDAIKLINWNQYIHKANTSILDLGGGTGWLSAYLSKFNSVDKVYMVDSSEYFLNRMFPEITRLMDGNIDKIIPIQGLFYPIMLEDKSLDIVVASSSMHHVDNIEVMIKEIDRVLKDDGTLFILNETPYNSIKYFKLISRLIVSIMSDLLFRRYRSVSKYISSIGCLYDPYLGDKAYPLWYWKGVIEKSGFIQNEIIETPYFTGKNDKRGIRLTHFICKKSFL